ncbi:uncharacterized protein [Palaemon carinicauda]|uniref:uncharacterized protein n=1 Tax=Palaemon carinicauda TaxID=392227 RepID=UPI0035B68774
MDETFAPPSRFFYEFMKNVVNKGESVPVDVIRPLLKSMDNYERNAYGTTYCAKCCTPWKLGLYRSRLLKRPKMNQLIKALLRKEQRSLKKLKQSEKLRLSLYRTQRNTLKVECLACKDKFKLYCSLPRNMKSPIIKDKRSSDKAFRSSLLTVESKKKKKKRKKEVNAGLLISSLSCSQHERLQKSECHEKLKGGKPSEIGASSQPDIGEPPIEKDVVQRLVDTLPVEGVSNVQSRLLVCKMSKARSKQKDVLNKTLKLKMDSDAAMNLKKKSALGNFLSSLI